MSIRKVMSPALIPTQPHGGTNQHQRNFDYYVNQETMDKMLQEANGKPNLFEEIDDNLRQHQGSETHYITEENLGKMGLEDWAKRIMVPTKLEFINRDDEPLTSIQNRGYFNVRILFNPAPETDGQRVELRWDTLDFAPSGGFTGIIEEGESPSGILVYSKSHLMKVEKGQDLIIREFQHHNVDVKADTNVYFTVSANCSHVHATLIIRS